jgi:hypothetical protein
LTKVIIKTLLIIDGLTNDSLSFKLISFGINDVNVFQGAMIEIT